jgi:hypothetical protein
VLLQIIWERGYMDAFNLGAYTADKKKDAFEVLQKETSLKHCIVQLHVFQRKVLVISNGQTNVGIG